MIQRRNWRFSDGMLLMGLAALALTAAWPIWVQIFERAINDPEQSHILLAPIVVAWLIWVRRERFRLCRPQWSLVGPAFVAAGWALIELGFRNGWSIFEHVGSIGLLLGAVLTVTGMQFFFKFAPAIGAMMFLMPAPGRVRQVIAMQLQEITAKITHFGMEIFGVGVERIGNVLVINSQEVAVAEACNGMRMVAALALVSYAFVFSTPMRNWARVFIFACSPVVAIVCNVVRLVPTVLMYGYASPDAADTFHDVSGWAVLFVALGILWMIFWLLRWLELPVAPLDVAED